MPEFEIGTEAELKEATSKFITMRPGAKEDWYNIEMQMPEWKEINKSLDFPVMITDDGLNFGKVDHLYTGIGKNGFKLNQTLDAVKCPKKPNANGNVSFDPSNVVTKKAVGHWIMSKGKNQTTGVEFDMPKLNDILPEGTPIPTAGATTNQKIM